MRISEGGRTAASGVDHSYLDDPRQATSGGILAELGCHTLDIALYVTGAKGYRVESCECAFDGQTDRRVSANVTLVDSPHLPAGGTQLEYAVSWLERKENLIVLEFSGTTIWAETSPGGGVHMGSLARPSSSTLLRSSDRAATTANQAFYLQWRSFLDGARSKVECEVSARSALLTTQLVDDMYSKARRNA
jgi:predicted dehydrogenase